MKMTDIYLATCCGIYSIMQIYLKSLNHFDLENTCNNNNNNYIDVNDIDLT